MFLWAYILLHFRTNSQIARLYSLAVLKAWRGQQITNRLLEAAVMAAKTQGCGLSNCVGGRISVIGILCLAGG